MAIFEKLHHWDNISLQQQQQNQQQQLQQQKQILWQSQFLMIKCHNILEITERLFNAKGHHILFCDQMLQHFRDHREPWSMFDVPQGHQI